MTVITYKDDPDGVDWAGMKEALSEDDFDNGRTLAQLETSFKNSAHICLAYAEGRLVGTARALSDDAADFYKKVGFVERPVGLEVVVGWWLENDPLPYEERVGT